MLRLQHEVFIAQAELASSSAPAAAGPRIAERHVRRIEEDTDRLGASLEPLRSFVLPRGTRAAAESQIARAVARRAERELWALAGHESVSPVLLQWSNRLSGLLFALALTLNRQAGQPEVAPDYSV